MVRLLSFDKAEMLDITDHETVVPNVAFQMVDMALAYVAKVAGSEGETADGEVKSQKVAHGWSVAGIGETNVVVIARMGYFIIRLSVLGREHAAGKGKTELIACGERHFFDMKRTDGDDGCSEVDFRFCLYRIVGIAHVVDHAQSGMKLTSRHDAQPFPQQPVVVPADAVIAFSGVFIALFRTVGCRCNETVHNALCRDTSVCPVGFPECLMQDVDLQTAVCGG